MWQTVSRTGVISPDRIVVQRVCEAEGINEYTKTYLATAC